MPVFLLAATGTAAAATYLVQTVRSGNGGGVAAAVLGVAATYAGAVAGHRAGAVSAGAMGLVLLVLAHIAHAELRIHRRLPAQTLHWPWRTSAAVAGLSVVLDVVVAAAGGGGQRRTDAVPTIGVAAVSLAIAALVAVVLVLAEGGPRLGLRRPAGALAATPGPSDPGAL